MSDPRLVTVATVDNYPLNVRRLPMDMLISAQLNATYIEALRKLHQQQILMTSIMYHFQSELDAVLHREVKLTAKEIMALPQPSRRKQRFMGYHTTRRRYK